jgi:hypothetical protein
MKAAVYYALDPPLPVEEKRIGAPQQGLLSDNAVPLLGGIV